MHALQKYCLVLISLIVIACASTTDSEEAMARYQFPELESVKSIQNWKMDGWEVIDGQSLIIQTSPTHFYLFVLSRRNPQLRFAEGILVSSTAGRVQVNFDTVATVREPMFKTPIAAIYKLDGRAQVTEIKQQIFDDKE
jgi:hypothetical protein